MVKIICPLCELDIRKGPSEYQLTFPFCSKRRAEFSSLMVIQADGLIIDFELVASCEYLSANTVDGPAQSYCGGTGCAY